jgi:N-methylhydantoinase B
MAEGSNGLGPGFAVISGQDTRGGNNATFVNQLFIGSQGGPGGPGYDGWVTFGNSVTNGLMLRDSVEVDEQKYPILIRQMRVRTDSGGVGEWRGAPGIVCEYGPVIDQMTAHYVTDGNVNPPRGVAGGGDAAPSEPYVLREGGAEVSAPLIGSVTLARGEMVGHRLSGGGGYGNPHDRPADSVRTDVLAGFVSFEGARNDYGVAFVRDVIDASLEVDVAATAALRGE